MQDIMNNLAMLWHGGQSSALYALQCGARDRDTLLGASIEFDECARIADTEKERSQLRVAARLCEVMAND